MESKSCCNTQAECTSSKKIAIENKINAHYISGWKRVNEMEVPRASTKLLKEDIIGAIKVRWSIGRNTYRVEPGLYSVGLPTENSEVFVTANYKLSFDHLRKNLDGLNAWILVLDTKGVNVWCAAGKGTFGTDELINRINLVKLHEFVNHRRIIVPQLGAVGVAGFVVKEKAGFAVKFGPVRANDIKPYLKNGMKATQEMRSVNFGFYDRLKLVPVDLVYNAKTLLLYAVLVVLVLSGLTPKGILFAEIAQNALREIFIVTTAFLSGVLLTPMLLPFIPFRSFALKGEVTALFFVIPFNYFNVLGVTILEQVGWTLIMTTISSFIALNFTGSSTYTSLSGVNKEMRISIPLLIIFSAFGLICLIFEKLTH